MALSRREGFHSVRSFSTDVHFQSTDVQQKNQNCWNFMLKGLSFAATNGPRLEAAHATDNRNLNRKCEPICLQKNDDHLS